MLHINSLVKSTSGLQLNRTHDSAVSLSDFKSLSPSFTKRLVLSSCESIYKTASMSQKRQKSLGPLEHLCYYIPIRSLSNICSTLTLILRFKTKRIVPVFMANTGPGFKNSTKQIVPECLNSNETNRAYFSNYFI